MSVYCYLYPTLAHCCYLLRLVIVPTNAPLTPKEGFTTLYHVQIIPKYPMDNKSLAQVIDHTLLRPDATSQAIVQCCEEAQRHHFAAVCIPPYFVKTAVKALEDSPVKVATVIGFPMGYAMTPAKVEEAKRAIDEGADELDMVVNICAIKEQNWSYVRNDIDSVTRAAHLKGKTIKVIFEMGLLTNEEVVQLCQICNDVEANYVKTSTGIIGTAATTDMLHLLKQHLDPSIKIKASAGIRTREQAIAMLQAGAHRIGTSAGLQIIEAL